MTVLPTPLGADRRSRLLAASAVSGTALLAASRAQHKRASARRLFQALHPHDRDAIIGMKTATLITASEAVEAARLAVAYRPSTFTNALRALVLDRKPGVDPRQVKEAFFQRCRSEIGPVFPAPGIYLPGSALTADAAADEAAVAAAVAGLPRQRRLRRTGLTAAA